MTLESEISDDGATLTIKVSGEFDSSVNNEFRALLDEIDVNEYRIDLKNAEYIDSAALGLLLVLREQASSNS